MCSTLQSTSENFRPVGEDVAVRLRFDKPENIVTLTGGVPTNIAEVVKAGGRVEGFEPGELVALPHDARYPPADEKHLIIVNQKELRGDFIIER